MSSWIMLEKVKFLYIVNNELTNQWYIKCINLFILKKNTHITYKTSSSESNGNNKLAIAYFVLQLVRWFHVIIVY